MENSSGRNARWSRAAAHQTEQTVEIERARQPVPFLLDPIQTAQKKTPRAKVLLDHRERPRAGMAAARVLLLRLVGCHLHRVRFTESFVLLPVDRPRFRLALNAHRQQRALRTVIRGRLVTAAFADAVAFLRARRPRVRQPLALGTPVAILWLVVNEGPFVELSVLFAVAFDSLARQALAIGGGGRGSSRNAGLPALL